MTPAGPPLKGLGGTVPDPSIATTVLEFGGASIRGGPGSTQHSRPAQYELGVDVPFPSIFSNILSLEGELHRWMQVIGHDGRSLHEHPTRWRFPVWHDGSVSTNARGSRRCERRASASMRRLGVEAETLRRSVASSPPVAMTLRPLRPRLRPGRPGPSSPLTPNWPRPRSSCSPRVGGPIPWVLATASCVGWGIGTITTSNLALLQSHASAAEMGRVSSAHHFIRSLGFAYGAAIAGLVMFWVVDRRTGNAELIRDLLS